jgi:hypothetical protein
MQFVEPSSNRELKTPPERPRIPTPHAPCISYVAARCARGISEVLKMRKLVFLIACFAALPVCGKEAPKPAQVVPTYELYSWQQPQGAWDFCLLYTTDRQKEPEEVFSEKTVIRGVAQLKREISKLPHSSRIVWFDRLTLNGVKIKGSEPLEYPTKEMIDDVKRYANSRGIKISGAPE